MELNKSDLCVHFSCPERSVFLVVYILLYVCAAAVVILTVCGNLLVIISILHFKQLHTPTNILVLSLAVSDFLIGSLTMPSFLVWTIESCWIFGTQFCMFILMTASLLMTLSIYHIVLIAVDRYLALSNPFLYASRVTVRITLVVVIFDWCLLVAYNLLVFYFNGKFMSSVMCPGECSISLNEVWSIIDLVYSFIFPLFVIIILYTRVFVIAKKHATAIRELNNHTRPETQKITSHSMKSERKAALVLGVLVSVFLMCLLPYFIYSLICHVIEVPAELFQNFFIMLYLNSAVNPIIYALFYPWFRRCIKIIITFQIFQTDSALINVFT